MEKRYRDYLRHLEKLDFEVLSEEEIFSEREGILLQTSVFHQELMRTMIAAIGFLMCASVFVSAGFISANIISFVCAGVFAIASAACGLHYKDISDTMKKMYFFVDKLTQV